MSQKSEEFCICIAKSYTTRMVFYVATGEREVNVFVGNNRLAFLSYC